MKAMRRMYLLLVTCLMVASFVLRGQILETYRRSGDRLRRMDFEYNSHEQQSDQIMLHANRVKEPPRISLSNTTKEGLGISSEQKHRMDSLSDGCQALSDAGTAFTDLKPSQLKHFIVNDEHKTVYCYIPKVACTNLKRVFILLSGHVNESDPLRLKSGDVHGAYDKYLTFLNSFSEQEVSRRLKTYRKVIFVREPMERILSAYRNKFQYKNTYFYERYGRFIIKRFRRQANSTAHRTGNDVSFLEFIKYLVDPKTIAYNEHWASFSNLCFPCQVQYDFVGKYETMDADVSLLLKTMGVSDVIKFPERSAMYKSSKTESLMMNYFSQIPPGPLKDLTTIYERDYQLINYSLPDVFTD